MMFDYTLSSTPTDHWPVADTACPTVVVVRSALWNVLRSRYHVRLTISGRPTSRDLARILFWTGGVFPHRRDYRLHRPTCTFHLAHMAYHHHLPYHLHNHHLHLLLLVLSFFLNLRLASLPNHFLHRPSFLPDWFHGLTDHLTFILLNGLICLLGVLD